MGWGAGVSGVGGGRKAMVGVRMWMRGHCVDAAWTLRGCGAAAGCGNDLGSVGWVGVAQML